MSKQLKRQISRSKLKQGIKKENQAKIRTALTDCQNNGVDEQTIHDGRQDLQKLIEYERLIRLIAESSKKKNAKEIEELLNKYR